jgi:hypothetical protein
MTRDRWDRLQASQSFKPEEIDVVRAMFATYWRGGDIKPFMKNPAMQKVAAKFARMSERIAVVKAERAGKTKPTREEELEAAYDGEG